ncbi:MULTISPECIES: SapC family protein [Roseateles]|uniref:SapC family protein n=1 Tax=Pelomonas caseinilytica TaxID=2906763 RepID=A0ABS8XED2_9BURK|nr:MULTISPECIES: SapC family protein [unclassified Roseateles]MCE4536834.1 SapC family protein [Pelomonas sp. P7]HEV6965926.1 SapC family protein [Roseateles sp.]
MLELLNNIQHKDLRIVTRRGAQWGDDFMSAPVTLDEFRKLQAHYPIVFQPDGKGSFLPVVLFGLQEGQNLFLTDEGWDADYLPLSVQRMPFSIGVAEGDELRMLVDMSSRRIGRGAEGEAVFLPHGGTTDFTENANAVLRTLHEGLQATAEFVETLVAQDLLEPFTLDVERPDGSHGQLLGFSIINEDRLAALDAGAVALLHQADYLMPIYMALASLSNFRALIKRHLAREA